MTHTQVLNYAQELFTDIQSNIQRTEALYAFRRGLGHNNVALCLIDIMDAISGQMQGGINIKLAIAFAVYGSDNGLSILDEVTKTLTKKGHDYVSDQDALSNFKRTAAMVGTSPAFQCLSMIATKVIRISNLNGGGKIPKNESVRDSFIDLIGYLVLYHCCLNDREEKIDSLSYADISSVSFHGNTQAPIYTENNTDDKVRFKDGYYEGESVVYGMINDVAEFIIRRVSRRFHVSKRNAHTFQELYYTDLEKEAYEYCQNYLDGQISRGRDIHNAPLSTNK